MYELNVYPDTDDVLCADVEEDGLLYVHISHVDEPARGLLYGSTQVKGCRIDALHHARMHVEPHASRFRAFPTTPST